MKPDTQIPGGHRTKSEKHLSCNYFFDCLTGLELAKKLMWIFLNPSVNLNREELKNMQINFLVNGGRTASAAINLISSSHAGSTSFTTHVPYFRDQ